VVGKYNGEEVEESSVGLSKALSHKGSGLLDVSRCNLLKDDMM
jgi:hypothetical protein